MNKRFANKTAFDPGRFRFSLVFYKQVVTITPDGSQTVDNVQVKAIRAVRDVVSRRVGLSLEGYLKEFGDAAELLGAWVFTIRKSSDFYPTKDMVFICEGDTYTPRIIQQVDEPASYIKILAVNTDPLITT